MQKINLSVGDLYFPDLLQLKTASLGNPGTGKTQTLRMVNHWLARAYPDLQQIIIDVIGVIHIAGFKRLIVRRDDADKGEKLGAILRKCHHEKLIIDISGVTTEDAVKFVDGMLRVYKPCDDTANVFMTVDEAHALLPQSHAKSRYSVELEMAAKTGRNFNWGMWFTSQRPAAFSKDVLELCQGLVILRLSGTNDREAVSKYLKGFMPESDVAAIDADIQTMPAFTCYLMDFRQ